MDSILSQIKGAVFALQAVLKTILSEKFDMAVSLAHADLICLETFGMVIEHII